MLSGYGRNHVIAYDFEVLVKNCIGLNVVVIEMLY